MTSRLKIAALFALACCAPVAQAHVVLPPGGATVGSTYAANFVVGHACKGSSATTALTVRLPAGFKLASATPREGWSLKVTADQVTWESMSGSTALDGKMPGSFEVTGKLQDTPGTLWFKALQTCDAGQADWAEIADGAQSKATAFPAPHLEVLQRGVAPVDVRDAWIQAPGPGQTSVSFSAALQAPSGLRLTEVSSPVAASASIHTMKMNDGTMTMEDASAGIELPPRTSVDLAAAGYHLMLSDLRQQLAEGSSVPVTLIFIDSQGVRSTVTRQVQVLREAPNRPTAAHHHAN